jgi:two-component system OmpR family sensor kinase
MSRSFRFRLAGRFTFSMFLGLAALSVLSFAAIREVLDREIDASLLNVASIQAATLTDGPAGEMHFHEWELTPEEAVQVRDLNRYAQVWSEDGVSLLRTQYITSDLPLDSAALARAAAGRIVWIQDRFEGIPVRSLFYPLGRLGPSHREHVLQVAAPLETRNRMLKNAALLMLALLIFVCGGTLAGSWWLAEQAVRPVQEIIREAEAIGPGRLGGRIDAWADSREYEKLVHVLNTMLSRIDSAFEAQRRFTADASHELRSPLTAMRGELELARRRSRTVDEYERVIDSALEEVVRLTRIAEDLLTLARSDAGVLQLRPRRTDLSVVAAKIVDRLALAASTKQVELTLRAGEPAMAFVDEDLVNRLVWNLISNAIKFTPAGGRVVVSVAGENGAVALRVTDTGPGVPEDAPNRIFERFFRTDEARSSAPETKGTGLGLAIVRAIADLHGAELAVRNVEGGGADFLVRFPPFPPGARATPAGPSVNRLAEKAVAGGAPLAPDGDR